MWEEGMVGAVGVGTKKQRCGKKDGRCGGGWEERAEV